uniref:glucan endo-1,3-beta-D-glucosidase n=1 Tax=Entomoneis paludosa TaxID=265537 RepID=A0A7S2YTX3_9STRA|mmetsp:Transcript_9920/g.20502  ORF Transcript_9920/g.20502 Transcript_9920/m.20502 type:complete len:977 (+) Transcript_9920:195-3125(+)|eukprot:CAMPEP_0172452776 /NCGR_PEP_ID=MMETSP1065-20121228/10335_1 /TAXON_ID=265537 /ORGANISM="Amphiprora paludosa, Strain CCMP125" /LENGTH=976 /DNA_ID=CAMNT_0013204889 /DNA_START=158 /DNA_END=3088 /DNA_ORIENTATION=+
MAPRPQEDATQKSNYGSVATTGDSYDEEEQQLLPTPLVVQRQEEEQARQTRKMTGLFLLGILVLAGVTVWGVSHANRPSSGSSMILMDDDSSSTTTTATTDRSSRYSTSGQGISLFVSSPDQDLGLQGTHREEDATPSAIWGDKAQQGPLPTNDWYLNLVSHRAASRPDESTRAYSTPYIVDTAADANMMGIRLHWPVVKASSINVQMVDDFKNAVTLGTLDLAAPVADNDSSSAGPAYQVDPDYPYSNLGVSLKWGDDDAYMKTSIVRGMPFATMKYASGVLPSLFSFNAPASKPVVDGGKSKMECGVLSGPDKEGRTISHGTTTTVQKELSLHFVNSDFTWMLFFSDPVQVECGVTEADDIHVAEFQLNVKSVKGDDEPLLVRLALADQCTTGHSNIHEHCEERNAMDDSDGYVDLLRKYTQYATNPKVSMVYPQEDDEEQTAFVSFDWSPALDDDDSSDDDVARIDVAEDEIETEESQNMMMFALPHQQDKLKDDKDVEITDYCIHSFHGKTCLVIGKKWNLSQDLSQPQSFTARRPPMASAIPLLAKALATDIQKKIPANLQIGAADTYFSGKFLAKIARTIMVAEELKQLAKGGDAVKALGYENVTAADLEESVSAAANANLPSDEAVEKAVNGLKQAVQVWMEDGDAMYVYDKSWGGLVNCGCNYTAKDSTGHCSNSYPNCPALFSVNEDFGNGYYNDHHFHYGYHVYAAAAVAKLDPTWGKAHFEEILLYIRDFANPAEDDPFFINFRQKDWWLGSSWASGIVSAENSPHGRDQESSSESIAAYEGMALYGQVMSEIFRSNGGSEEQKNAAQLIQNAGELLTVTEVEAADRYWHVWDSDSHNSTYPLAYSKLTVGMMYDTMASFATWFSQNDVVSYGIQLMPFTAVAERRDDKEWAKLLYPVYKDSCEDAGDFCIDNGWSIVQAGLCATAGFQTEALEQAFAVPPKVFLSDGGMGNSLSNTIWYIATRS